MTTTMVMLAGRGLLAALFILAGVTKIVQPKPVLEHMTAEHVPTLLLPAVIALELACGIALLIGFRPGLAAGALSLFCIATALVFHRNFAVRAERTLFAKDLALAGGLAFIAASAMA